MKQVIGAPRWCLNATAVGFEQPFGGDLNDIDHMELQMSHLLLGQVYSFI